MITKTEFVDWLVGQIHNAKYLGDLEVDAVVLPGEGQVSVYSGGDTLQVSVQEVPRDKTVGDPASFYLSSPILIPTSRVWMDQRDYEDLKAHVPEEGEDD